jgi:hypothetical protein
MNIAVLFSYAKRYNNKTLFFIIMAAMTLDNTHKVKYKYKNTDTSMGSS